MASLTKKQTAQLSDMNHDVLVNIIHDLIQGNKQARTKCFYDYYDADAFFDELTRSMANPLVGIAHELPEQAESLSVKMMLEFEKFTGNVDTSSGIWMGYYTILLDAWMKSLEAQKITVPHPLLKKYSPLLKKNSILELNFLKNTEPYSVRIFYV